jgi:hypothetical protein
LLLELRYASSRGRNSRPALFLSLLRIAPLTH